jgi:hypothetical protein
MLVSGGVMFIPRFMKIYQLFKKLLERTAARMYRHNDIINVYIYLFIYLLIYK